VQVQEHIKEEEFVFSFRVIHQNGNIRIASAKTLHKTVIEGIKSNHIRDSS
jgi:hypothetical protein